MKDSIGPTIDRDVVKDANTVKGSQLPKMGGGVDFCMSKDL